MRGYIGITSRQWYESLICRKLEGEYNFWRKSVSQFKIISKGDLFFFLVKNQRSIKEERKVYGYGFFERYEVNTLEEAWDKYKKNNGMDSLDELNKVMLEIYGAVSKPSIGCIILRNVNFFDNPVHLSHLGIDFDKSIVSGKSISEVDTLKIIDELNKTNEEIFEFETNLSYESDPQNEMFPEGSKMLRLHLSAERNSKLIERAKEFFLIKHGKLFCEVCGFDFEDVYGDLGKHYIEGHHIIPVSQLKGEGTRVKDIVMLCSNCHSMIHRKRPWLGINELKKLKR